MKILFVAGFGPIVSDMQANQAFYQEVLGLSFEGDESYLSTQHLDGVKHFALCAIDGSLLHSPGTLPWAGSLGSEVWIWEVRIWDMLRC